MRKRKHKFRLVKAYDNSSFIHSADGRLIRIIAEMLEPQHRFRRQKVRDSIVFFGSARCISSKEAQANLTKAIAEKDELGQGDAEVQIEMSRYYDAACQLSEKLTAWSVEKGYGYCICSGGGPGVMEAANKGASQVKGGRSIGLNISLPFEQECNSYISDELNFEFNYFFVRKFWFAYMAKAMIAFPGGFGTLDELAEILTLIQTQKIRKELPFVLFGSEFWKRIIDFDELLRCGVISKEDMELFVFCDSVEEAYDYLIPELERLYDLRHKAEGHVFREV